MSSRIGRGGVVLALGLGAAGLVLAQSGSGAGKRRSGGSGGTTPARRAPDREAIKARLRGIVREARSRSETIRKSPHGPFSALLARHVKDGRVSYKGFRADEAKLDAYLATLAAADTAAMSRDEKMAFWINAYNAYTIKLILKKYPDITSIKDFWRPWKGHYWKAGGREINLSDMEHEVLRKMGDPRIHAAINCASFSCPDLANEAYVAPLLDDQLAKAMRVFLASPEKGFRAASEPGRIYGTNHNVYLSKIFSWFAADFGPNQAAQLAAIRPYLPEAGRAFLDRHRGEIRVNYMPYDWKLNGE